MALTNDILVYWSITGQLPS